MRKLLFLIVMSMAITCHLNAATIGYTCGTHSRSNGVRNGSGTTQGIAIRLNEAKATLLKGQTISAVRAAFCSSRFTTATLFITSNIDGDYLYSQSVTTSSTWKEYTLDTPYTMTGEELYIGFIGEISTSYSPLSLDGSTGQPSTTYVYGDDGWEDYYSAGYGTANIQLILEGDTTFTDATLRAPSTTGYYTAGETYNIEGYQLFNFGTDTITAIDVTIALTATDGDDTTQSYSTTGLTISPAQLYDLTLPFTAPQQGSYTLEVSITSINGAADADTTDNNATEALYVYPAGITRNYLIENFTGQTCTYCPAGHTLLQNAIEGREDVIIVSHHAGYAADEFTMEEDIDLTWLYNATSTFAPAFMVNRYRYDGQASSLAGPVFNASTTTEFTARIAMLAEQQPYVSVDISSTYNEDERTLTGQVNIQCYNTPPSDSLYLNLYIIQDSIVAYQTSGGDEYTHRHAFRGTVGTGAFGLPIVVAADSTTTYPFTYTLPETIESTYSSSSQGAFATDVQRMTLVAFVANYNSSDPNDCIVYNAAATPFTKSATAAIHEVEGARKDNTTTQLYNLQGKAVANPTPGIYILRQGNTAKKIIIP